jgi:hypothetical protein
MSANNKSAGRIYVYSAPGYDQEWERTVGTSTVSGRGKFKVGFTGRPDPRVRIKEQTGTLYPDGGGITIHIDEIAVKDDGSHFDDRAVHKVLDSAGINRHSEVVEATLSEIKAAIAAVRAGRKYDATRTEDFGPRPEQAEAIRSTAEYFKKHAKDKLPPRFLWNAKMRFGKTFATYQLAKTMNWTRVLVLTYKPAVRNSWRDDLLNHVSFVDWLFVDRENPVDPEVNAPIVWFASFQDLLGTTSDGNVKDHNENLHLIDWDCVVLDEYHFGAWQGAAKELTSPANTAVVSERVEKKSQELGAEESEEVASLANAGTPRLFSAVPESDIETDLDAGQLRLSSRNFLYLSGTPFRALTEGEFNEDAIYNWTYPQEQAAKQAWSSDKAGAKARNPYLELPEMQMFTYALSEIADSDRDDKPDGHFDLSGFFAAKKVGSEYHFDDPGRVSDFLNMLRGKLTQSATNKLLSDFKPPFPFSDSRFSGAINHSVWLMPNVASAHAMKAHLESDPFFTDFLVHVAAGAGAKMGAEAKGPVDDMLAKAAKLGKQTITLSVAKLMTGVTVPQWGAILILRSLKSPESYFQAAFRVQSPWTVKLEDGTRIVNKETCFVFDFDPNRALSLIYQYGTKLAGGATRTSPADVISELIEYLPIFAFDGGRMDEVDTRAVMDWGTAGAGAAMLAKRWGSPRLIDLSEPVLQKLLAENELVERLKEMEDFRKLREDVNKIISQSQKVRAGKKTSASGEAVPDDPEIAKIKKSKRDQVNTLRSKLLKFVQAVPVFMYLTDFREEALVDVIESLDTQLFERVTGLTLADFHKLSEVGVFHPGHMNEAIWQFRLFEEASLNYIGLQAVEAKKKYGLWDKTITSEEFHGS